MLIIGVGGGRDVIAAKRWGATHITGIELDPATLDLIQNRMVEVNRGFFNAPDIELIAGEGRHYVQKSKRRFDLIQMTGIDTLATTASGAYLLSENYLYSVEAFEQYLGHLKPGGLVSIATGLWRMDEPRSAARMLTVARAALERRGARDPARHIAIVHSNLLVAEVLVKNEPFSRTELERLAAEANRLQFTPLVLGNDGDPIWLTIAGPDSPARDKLLATTKYEITPIYDDNPFFFHFFRWKDLLETKDLGPMHTTALAQVVLAVLLGSLTLLAVVLIGGPLLLLGRNEIPVARRTTLGILGYFLAIGLGFMLFEVSLMQRLVLYLGYPTYALSVVLFTLLTFLGIGSLTSNRWVGRERPALLGAFGALTLLALFYMFVFPSVQNATLGLALWIRVAVSVLVLAPLGLTLGLFLPLGIRRVADIHRDLVPWAWAVNGCASVTATVLAVVLAMSFGFQKVWLLSLLVYALGIAAFFTTHPSHEAAASKQRVPAP